MKKFTMARFLAVSSAVTAMTAAMTTYGTSPALAADSAPCGGQFTHHTAAYGNKVQHCPLWRSNVPVDASGVQPPRKIGSLVHGGSTNWFVCQATGYELKYGSYRNKWWAFTESDQGKWGWVNEVYFSGGGNNQPDSRLRHC